MYNDTDSDHNEMYNVTDCDHKDMYTVIDSDHNAMYTVTDIKHNNMYTVTDSDQNVPILTKTDILTATNFEHSWHTLIIYILLLNWNKYTWTTLYQTLTEHFIYTI